MTKLLAIERHLAETLRNLDAAHRWAEAFNVGDGGMNVAMAYGHEAVKHACRAARLAARLDAERKP